MENITKQDRITLKNLKVADFASEETMCFSATVVFDGTPIAEARNDGQPPRPALSVGQIRLGRPTRNPAGCAAPGPAQAGRLRCRWHQARSAKGCTPAKRGFRWSSIQADETSSSVAGCQCGCLSLGRGHLPGSRDGRSS